MLWSRLVTVIFTGDMHYAVSLNVGAVACAQGMVRAHAFVAKLLIRTANYAGSGTT